MRIEIVALAVTLSCGSPRTDGGRPADRPIAHTMPSATADAGMPARTVDAEIDAGVPADATRRTSITFTHGGGGARDPAKIDEASRQCDAGKMSGCHALGLALMTPGSPDSPNNVRAAAAFETGCTGGYAAACNGLGVMYAQGLGVPRDEARAVTLQTQSCQEGNVTGCLHVAYAYEAGRGVPKNDQEAAAFYGRACKLGSTEGCAKTKPPKR